MVLLSFPLEMGFCGKGNKEVPTGTLSFGFTTVSVQGLGSPLGQSNIEDYRKDENEADCTVDNADGLRGDDQWMRLSALPEASSS
jgi:hypothetical protein